MIELRFKGLLAEAALTRPRFSRIERSALVEAGRSLTAQDVLEVLAELDAMSIRRNHLPEWDGDSSDDIAIYQEHLASLLAGTSGAARDTLLRDDNSRQDMTRVYIALATCLKGS